MTRTMTPTPFYEPSLRTMFFEIAIGSLSQACSVKMHGYSDEDAKKAFSRNRHDFETMAMKCYHAKQITNGEIKLAAFAG